MSGHDADLALSRSDHTGAVRTNETNAQLITTHFRIEHIKSWNALSDADNEFYTGIRGFQDRILTKRRGHIDH